MQQQQLRIVPNRNKCEMYLLKLVLSFLYGAYYIGLASSEYGNSSLLAPYEIDDILIRNHALQMDLLNASSENMRLRLEMLGLKFQEQMQLLKEIDKKLNAMHRMTESECDDDTEGHPFRPTLDVRIGGGPSRKCPTKPKVPAYKTVCVMPQRYPQTCAEATGSSRQSGIYLLRIEKFSDEKFLADCDEETHGGGWTIVQRRLDGSVDFQRNWTDFQKGFGNIDGEYFIGLDKLHALTTYTGPQELIVVMEDFDNVSKYAIYDEFAIGNADEKYALKRLGKYSGDAGDSLSGHAGQKFTTKDQDNDNFGENCAVKFTGAWWHNKCHVSNLNGQYLRGSYPEAKFAQGVVWKTFRGYNYSLKSVKMMIRPQKKKPSHK